MLTAAVAPRVPHASWGERARWRRGWRRGPYFVNCRPGGFASAQSRDLQLAREMRLGMDPNAHPNPTLTLILTRP